MSNPFQPWKPHPPNLFNTTSGNYMQYHAIAQVTPQSAAASIQNYSTLHGQIGLDHVSTSTPSIQPTTTNFGNNSNSSGGSNKGGPNYHKINSIDKMVGLDSLVDEQIDNNSTSGGVNREERNNKLRQFAEKNISDGAKQQILHVLEKISQLSPMEKLLLYLRLPGGFPETDPLRQSQNPLGQRSEINHTINWVKSHLEHDDNVSIPKQDVYDDYVSYCGRVNIKPLSTADFGKVMKQVFPNIRPRRLGTRGNSRYCYAAMRKATKLDCPMLPEIGNSTNTEEGGFDFQTHENSWRTVKSWSEGLLSMEFESLEQLAEHINKQHLNSPASISSRQLLQKKLLQKELKEKKKMNENSLKKRRKKRRKLSSHSDSVQNFDENSKNPEPDTNTSSKSPGMGSQNGQESKRDVTQCTNDSCDERATDNSDVSPKSTMNRSSKSPEMRYKKVKPTRFVQPQTASTIMKRASNLVKQMDNEDEDDDEEELGESKTLQQQQGTMRLKKIRLTPRTDFGSISTSTINASSNNNLQQQQTSVSESGGMDTSEQSGVPEIPLPLSRERMISLCTINKDELGCYLPDLADNDTEENSQDQEVELMQIFQAEGKTHQQMNNNNNNFNSNHNLMNNSNGKTHNSSIPVLENYQLQLPNSTTNNNNISNHQMRHQISQQNKISELRNLLEHNLQHQQHHMSGANGPNLCAADTLAMLSQRHSVNDVRHQMHGYSVIQRKLGPNFSSGTHKNTFIPIPTAGSDFTKNTSGHQPVDTSPFVSPRATPIAKSKRNHNLPSLQMVNNMPIANFKPIPIIGNHNTAFTRPTHFKQELPASAPTSPSLCGTFRYYSGQPANTASTIFHPIESRSQSVPLHQQPQDDYSAYSSACNSVNPTPVPSEFHDFDEQQNSLLEMFSSESGVVPNIKMENDLMSSDFLDTDEVSSTIDMQELLPDSSKSNLSSLMSRSVPNTPLPCNYNHINNSTMKDANLACANNNNLHMPRIDSTKYPQSVPTTPVPPGCAFRYTPPASRDYLINGYNNQLEQKLAENVEQVQALAANSSFMTSNEQNLENSLDYQGTSVTSANDPIIESDIFNEMT